MERSSKLSMRRQIKITNPEIKALIEVLKDIQEDINELRNEIKRLDNAKLTIKNEKGEISIEEFQEDMIKIEEAYEKYYGKR